MKRILPFLLLLPAAVFAAERTFDFRAPSASGISATSSRKGAQAAGSGPVRRSVSGWVPSASGLAPGDTVSLLLFDDTRLDLLLEEAMPAPISPGRVFTASLVGGTPGRTAVVIDGPDGLTATVAGVPGGNVIRVFPSGGSTVVEERDPSAEPFSESGHPVPDLPRETVRDGSEPPRASNEQSDQLVDVLVAYDNGAQTWVRQNGGMTNFAEVAVQRMNAALANTGLDALFRFRLVGVATVDATCTDVPSTLTVAQGGSGVWAALHAARDAVGADTVTVLIDNGSSTGTTGQGYSLTETTSSGAARFSDYAYNVCLVRSVAVSDTMTHETGHNMGCGHSDTQTMGGAGPQSFPYSSGYHFVGNDGVRYHTVMAYYTDGTYSDYKAIPFFSSPDFEYAGVPVGTASANDNTRVLRQTFGWAGAWRARKIPLSYDVSFSPDPGSTFSDSIVVTLTPGKSGLPVRYTLDGTDPAPDSPLYEGPITLVQTTTIRAAVVFEGALGPVSSAIYSLSDLGAAIEAPQLNWSTSDTHPWVFETTNTWDGVDALMTTDDGSYWDNLSWLKTSVTGPATVSFRYRTRKHVATFSVSVDGTDVFSDTEDSGGGGSDWSLQQFDVPAGTHEITFTFKCWIETGSGMSGGRWNGYNGAWLDTVSVVRPQSPYGEWADANVDGGAPGEVTAGVENAFRYVFGKPAEAFSPILAAAPGPSGGSVLRLPALVNTDGVTLTVLSTTNLLDWVSAVETNDVTAGPDGTVTLPVGGPRRFFRLKAVIE